MVAQTICREDATERSARLDILEQALDCAMELRSLVDMTGIASLRLLAEMLLREIGREIDADEMTPIGRPA